MLGNLRRHESSMIIAYSVIIPERCFSEHINAFFSGRSISVLFSRFVLILTKFTGLYILYIKYIYNINILYIYRQGKFSGMMCKKTTFQLKICCIWLLVGFSWHIYIGYYILFKVHTYYTHESAYLNKEIKEHRFKSVVCSSHVSCKIKSKWKQMTGCKYIFFFLENMENKQVER